jgi:hypothetical protein
LFEVRARDLSQHDITEAMISLAWKLTSSGTAWQLESCKTITYEVNKKARTVCSWPTN